MAVTRPGCGPPNDDETASEWLIGLDELAEIGLAADKAEGNALLSA